MSLYIEVRLSAIHSKHYYFTLHNQYLIFWLQIKYISSLVLDIVLFDFEYRFHSLWYAFYKVFASVRVLNWSSFKDNFLDPSSKNLLSSYWFVALNVLDKSCSWPYFELSRWSLNSEQLRSLNLWFARSISDLFADILHSFGGSRWIFSRYCCIWSSSHVHIIHFCTFNGRNLFPRLLIMIEEVGEKKKEWRFFLQLRRSYRFWLAYINTFDLS